MTASASFHSHSYSMSTVSLLSINVRETDALLELFTQSRFNHSMRSEVMHRCWKNAHSPMWERKKNSFDYIIETITNYLIIVKIQRELNSAVLIAFFVKPFTLSLFKLQEHWAHSQLATSMHQDEQIISTHLITEWRNTPEWLEGGHPMTIPITLLFAAVLLALFCFSTLNQSGSVVICSNDSYFFPYLFFVSSISQS